MGLTLEGLTLEGLTFGANLRGADLWGCTGNNGEVKTIQSGAYTVTYTEHDVQIGCQRHTWEEWQGFTDKEINVMDCQALEWWGKWKPILQEIMK
ncbi:hypothetical protein JKY79_01050 [Candidatus Babeliales bacterium]|nr:hypothetical protein [Candidatus Babeliales bacterium]